MNVSGSSSSKYMVDLAITEIEKMLKHEAGEPMGRPFANICAYVSTAFIFFILASIS